MADEPDSGGFLARWSRRKALVREGKPADAEAVPAPAVADALPARAAATVPPTNELQAVPPASTTSVGSAADPAATTPAGAGAEERRLPTMADVQALTPESDFAPFTAKAVDPAVRNAALKKLFHGEPQFNVMDGLDVYIDDYSQPDPLPRSMLRMMQQARELGLLDDELVDQDKPPPDAAPDMAAGPSAPVDTPPLDETADLQLQPDDAPGREGAGPGAGAGLGDESAEVARPGQPEPGRSG